MKRTIVSLLILVIAATLLFSPVGQAVQRRATTLQPVVIEAIEAPASGTQTAANSDSVVCATDIGCLLGTIAAAFGSNPTAVSAGANAKLFSNRAGVLFTLGGHPNIVTTTAQIQDVDGAQTDAAIVTVSTGLKIVVTRVMASCDNATTAGTNIKVGFGTSTLPASAHTGVVGIIHDFDNVPPGGGYVVGNGGGIIGVGADNEDVRITTEDPVGGNCSVSASYFTIES